VALTLNKAMGRFVVGVQISSRICRRFA
jgi:hypothetical protein